MNRRFPGGHPEAHEISATVLDHNSIGTRLEHGMCMTAEHDFCACCKGPIVLLGISRGIDPRFPLAVGLEVIQCIVGFVKLQHLGLYERIAYTAGGGGSRPCLQGAWGSSVHLRLYVVYIYECECECECECGCESYIYMWV